MSKKRLCTHLVQFDFPRLDLESRFAVFVFLDHDFLLPVVHEEYKDLPAAREARVERWSDAIVRHFSADNDRYPSQAVACGLYRFCEKCYRWTNFNPDFEETQ